jgi:hypothetical protein
MPVRHRVLPVALSLFCVAGIVGNAHAQSMSVLNPQPAAPGFSAPFPPSQVRPTLLDFVTGMPLSYRAQVAATPKLLRPAFANQPVTSPKGLASSIKAQQLDVKNRVKAVRFLGEQDCIDGTFQPVSGEEPPPKVAPKPSDAQMVLIKTMQTDPSEVVRYEAVLALENMLKRGPCGKGHNKKANRGKYENCLGCCNEIVMTALSDRAYKSNDLGCPLEPSERVRNAAIHALGVCGIDCYPGTAPTAVPDPINNQGIEQPPPAPAVIEEAPPAQPADQVNGAQTSKKLRFFEPRIVSSKVQ